MPKAVKRYDPVSGAVAWVDPDSEEAAEWPTRKPKKRARTRAAAQKVLGPVVGEVAVKAAPKIARRLETAVGRTVRDKLAEAARVAQGAGTVTGALTKLRTFATAPAKAAMKAAPAGTAGLVIAAGLLSYWLTKKLLAIPSARRNDRSEKAFAAAQAYRLARDELAGRLGRQPSRQEQEHLAAAFKAELAKLGLSTTDLSKL